MDNYASLEDDALLAAVYASSQEWVKMQAELERRFTERDTKVIESAGYTANQRQDTERYVFTEMKLDDYVGFEQEKEFWEEANEARASARQISRPYAKVTKKEPKEMAL